MKKDDALTRARVIGVPWWRRAIAWFRGRGLKALPEPARAAPVMPPIQLSVQPRLRRTIEQRIGEALRPHSPQFAAAIEFGGPPSPEIRFIQPPLADTLAAVIESLDRVCSACMAATSDETAALLHRGIRCKIYERSQRPPPTSMPGPLDSRKG